MNIYVQATDVQDQASLYPQTDLHHLKLVLEYPLLVFVCLYCWKKSLCLCLEYGKKMNLNEQAVGGVFFLYYSPPPALFVIWYVICPTNMVSWLILKLKKVSDTNVNYKVNVQQQVQDVDVQ